MCWNSSTKRRLCEIRQLEANTNDLQFKVTLVSKEATEHYTEIRDLHKESEEHQRPRMEYYVLRGV
jgi:hypothetical protein